MLNLAHNPTKIVAVGMSGCGKTLYANQTIERSNYGTYFVFDHDGQFSQRNRLRSAFTREQIAAQLKRRFVVYDPSEMFHDTTAAFDWFCCFVYRLSERLPGTKLLYCDELQDVCGTNRAPDWVRKVLVSGRTKSLDFMACSLQYNQIHNAIRGQATITVAFKTEESLALKALTERGFNASSVAALRPGQFLLRNHRKGTEERGKMF